MPFVEGIWMDLGSMYGPKLQNISDRYENWTVEIVGT